MTELKTLKDIFIEPLCTITKAKNNIRAEAIRWINDASNPEARAIMMSFFNLTLKDLEGGEKWKVNQEL